MTILTKRCTLRPLELEDIPRLSRLFTNRVIRKFLGGATSREDANEKLKRDLIDPQKQLHVVCLSHNETIIGLISLAPYTQTGEIEISYQFFTNFWGKGYAFETLNAVISQAFEAHEIPYLFAETQSANTRSTALLEKLGMTHVKSLTKFSAEQRVYKLVKQQ